MKFKAVTLGFVLAGTALGSAALNLGRARGAAWIGQPLELTVPVQLDPGQSDTNLCAEADVFHGDSKQDSSRVQVVASPSDQPDTYNLKITSSALIDEPVVTIYLRAGCGQKVSRKYVLLADFPSDAAAPLSRSATTTAPQVPLVIPTETPSASSANSANKPVIKNSKPTVAADAEAAKPVPKEAPKEAVKPAAKPVAKEAPKETPKEAPVAKKEAPAKVEKPVETAKPEATGKSRLRLDPVETLNERVKSLESNTTASTAQQEAAARDGQKIQSLQSDLKTLLDQAVKNEASLAAMRERLEKAESERVPVTMVYALVALVVLCLGTLAYIWSRRPRYPAWENSQMGRAPAPAAPKAAPVAAAAQGHRGMDVNTMDMDDEAFDALLSQPSQAQKKR